MPDLSDLIDVSARVGRNRLLVQGGGGNSSLKSDGVMWVKASGYWLSDADHTPMFVPLDLASTRTLAAQHATSFAEAIRTDLPGADLRPSIETALHALMPQRYVFHAHPVNMISASLHPEARDNFSEKLSGLRYAVIDYVKPGADLAAAVGTALAADTIDTVVLANHGLIVGADSAREAEARLEDVETRLAQPSTSLPAANPPETSAPSGYAWSDNPVFTALALVPERASLLCHGALVPDQVVYLGGPACWINHLRDLEGLKSAWQAARGVVPGVVFVAGQGALVRDDLSKGGHAMLDLLAEIAVRLPLDVRPNTLSVEQELDLLNWDAEKYRLALDMDRA